MADLVAAIRATTEAARDRAVAAVEADATQVTEAIRAGSTGGAEAIRHQADGDLAAIKERSKAELARIREETEARIEERKAALASDLASHAAAVEHRVGEVEEAVAQYHADMDRYFLGLSIEEDPARLATMAEAMPEPPPLDALADLADLDVAAFAPVTSGVPAPQAAIDAPAPVETDLAETAATVNAEPEAPIEDPIASSAVQPDAAPDTVTVDGETVTADDASVATGEPDVAGTWNVSDNAWLNATADVPAAEAVETPTDGVPRWVAGETPDGFPSSAAGGDPVDRGAIMAALEAAAEAVVAAESAAESADQAEAAAGVAETAAELIVGRASDEEIDDAQAAMSARVDAGGFETQSFADRLASLMPGHGEGSADGEARTTQIIVTGLVSVASIASFKRHLGRVAGVQTVGVASGPDGEFMFNVGHRPDVSFRDAIPSMAGFAARVTATADGVVSVTARDPEAEG
jgi:hypothetical protein